MVEVNALTLKNIGLQFSKLFVNITSGYNDRCQGAFHSKYPLTIAATCFLILIFPVLYKAICQ